MPDLQSITDDLIAADLTDPIVHIPFAAKGEDQMARVKDIVNENDLDYTLDEEYGDGKGNVVKTGQIIVDLR